MLRKKVISDNLMFNFLLFAASRPKVSASPKKGEKCFLDENPRLVRCTASQPGVPIGKRSLPLVLGVGPAKTSSTALFDYLGQHPSILLGNASALGHKCCESELYYFSRRFEGDNPAAGFAKYFSPAEKSGAKWVSEKTPEYSDHFLVPYRLRATVQPSSVALVYTIRDPIDAHVSLYIYRMKRKNLPATTKGFVQWSKTLVNAHWQYKFCIERALTAAQWDEPTAEADLSRRKQLNSNATVLPVTPTWVGKQSIDEAVFLTCRAPYFRPADRLEGVGSLGYSQTLPRWKKVMKGARAMCIFHDDFVLDPKKQAKRVAKMLGVDAEKFKPFKSDEDGVNELSGEERVLGAEGGKDPAIAELAKRHLERLRNLVFAGEMEFAKKFCSQL